MKSFVNYALLACLVTLFCLSDQAMAQRNMRDYGYDPNSGIRVSLPAGRDQRIPKPMPQNPGGLRFIDLEIQPGSCISGAFSPDGQRIVTSDNRGCSRGIAAIPSLSFDRNREEKKEEKKEEKCIIQIWDAMSGQLLRTLSKKFALAKSVAISSDEKKLFIVFDKSVLIWDIDSETELQSMKGDLFLTYGFSSATFSPDGKKIVTTHSNFNLSRMQPSSETAIIWDVESGRPLFSLTHTCFVRDVIFSPDGKKIITSSCKAIARSAADDKNNIMGWVWATDSGKRIGTLMPSYHGGNASVIFSPDERKFAIIDPYANRDGVTNTFLVSDFGTNKKQLTIVEQRPLNKEEEFGIETLQFSPDGKKILTCGTISPKNMLATEQWKWKDTIRIWFLE